MNSYKLKNAKLGEVVTRFPPEASGFLHIGHAKAAIINYMISKEYNGKCLLRFDDTNPNKENVEFENEILHDLAILRINYTGPSYTSDYFDTLIHFAEILICVSPQIILINIPDGKEKQNHLLFL
jgi:glutamyl/glutaminyl-tRNA synthetase